MSQNVPLRAIALRYEGGDAAPVVTASGEGVLAEKIIQLAQASDIPLKQDALLAELLEPLALGEEIPPLLYRVIAEVIAYAYFVSGKVPE